MDIDGKAILFESGIYAKIPADLPEKLALSALDVAGAPAQTAKLVKPGDTVLIIGAGGKSGMLCCYEAKKRAGVTGKVIGLCHSEKSTKRLQDLGFCDYVFSADATQPVPVLEKIEELTGGQMCDITINNVNIPDTEMTSILCTKDTGLVYFFSQRLHQGPRRDYPAGAPREREAQKDIHRALRLILPAHGEYIA